MINNNVNGGNEFGQGGRLKVNIVLRKVKHATNRYALLLYLMTTLALPVVFVLLRFNTSKLLSTRFRISACIYDLQQ